jgi:hypothetical protein
LGRSRLSMVRGDLRRLLSIRALASGGSISERSAAPDILPADDVRIAFTVLSDQTAQEE